MMAGDAVVESGAEEDQRSDDPHSPCASPNKWKEARPLFLLPVRNMDASVRLHVVRLCCVDLTFTHFLPRVHDLFRDVRIQQARMVRERMATPQKESPHSCDDVHFTTQERALKEAVTVEHLSNTAQSTPQSTQSTQRDSYIFPIFNPPISHSKAPDAPASHTPQAETADMGRALDADLKCQAQQHTVGDKQGHCNSTSRTATRQQHSHSNAPKPHQQSHRTTHAPSHNKLHTTPASNPTRRAACSARKSDGAKGHEGKTPASPTSSSKSLMAMLPLLPRAELVCRVKVLQTELTFCKERLRAATDHLQIANEGQARAFEQVALLHKKLAHQRQQMSAQQQHAREQGRRESDTESSQLQAEMSLERGARLLEESEHEQERELHDLQILKLGSEISTLKLAARQAERQRETRFSEW